MVALPSLCWQRCHSLAQPVPLDLSLRGLGVCVRGLLSFYFLSRTAASSPRLAGSLSPFKEACVPLIMFSGRRGVERGEKSWLSFMLSVFIFDLGSERSRVELMSVVFLCCFHAE